MPSFNFHKRFAELVASGKKRQTIRALRKDRQPQVGDVAHCFTGLRTRNTVKLGCWPIIYSQSIRIYTDTRQIILGCQVLEPAHREQLARDDGFADINDMLDWFRTEYGGADFEGRLIAWDFDSKRYAGEMK